jgi:hypothetical protein
VEGDLSARELRRETEREKEYELEIGNSRRDKLATDADSRVTVIAVERGNSALNFAEGHSCGRGFFMKYLFGKAPSMIAFLLKNW